MDQLLYLDAFPYAFPSVCLALYSWNSALAALVSSLDFFNALEQS